LKHNIRSLREMKATGLPISWLTCYDYSFATALSESDLDMILVGDSGGMVALGYSDTVPVTMDEMVLLSAAVRRGAPNKFIVGDMPKGSYEASDVEAVNNAMRFMKEAGCDAIKLEGAQSISRRVAAIADAGIPVIGHIGLTPQSSSALGGYRVIGRDSSELDALKKAVQDLESAGAFAILIEAIPPSVAKDLTASANSIIFGIGAGKFTDGQLLILHDLLGLFPSFRPKFAKCYISEVMDEFNSDLSAQKDLAGYGRSTRKDGLHELSRLAVSKFVEDVREKKFPSDIYSYKE
jgi:3-methyl-2-oxobutanoate hydroxymethyltransferase